MTESVQPGPDVVEAFLGALVVFTPEGLVQSWNAGAESLFGYTAQEALGRSLFDLMVPSDRVEETGEFIRRALLLGSAEYESARRRKDGSPVSVAVSLRRMQDAQGRTLLAENDRDISQITYLRQSQMLDSQFRGLLEAAPDAMVIMNQEGRLVLVNAQAERLFGYTRQELLGTPVEALVPDRFRQNHPGYRRGYFHDPRPRPMGAGLDLAGRRKDGSEFPAEISLSPMETAHGVFATAAIRDVTERKRLEEQRRRSLQEASRLKSEFLANMSHELRTPLNAIIGFAELMHDGKVGTVSADQKEFLGDILTSSHHLLQLINDVLDLSKVEAGRMEFRPERVDMGKVVGEVRDILRSLAASKRIQISAEIAPGVAEVTVDPSKLKQVLYNYLSNALKFTGEKGRVSVRVRPEGPDAFRLEVEDDGIGIAPADAPRLFVEFQQLDASTAKKYAGTGLGLALTRRIVEAQGGRVGVRSRPGEGSVFFAVLPRISELVWEAAEAPPLARSSRPRVLVIEDDARDQAWLSEQLSQAGYSVECVSTGAAAIARAEETVFDAITLDLLLPDMGGHEVLRAIRSEGPNRRTPVIVATVVPQKGLSAGFHVVDVLLKPVQVGDLLDALSHAGVALGGGARVVVVDDDPLALKLAERGLREAGFDPSCCSDGELGLQAVERDPPAAIVLDLVMTSMNGFDFLERLRRSPRGRRVPVIVWTQKDLSADERARLAADAEAVVSKAEGPGSLIEELRGYARPAGRLVLG